MLAIGSLLSLSFSYKILPELISIVTIDFALVKSKFFALVVEKNAKLSLLQFTQKTELNARKLKIIVKITQNNCFCAENLLKKHFITLLLFIFTLLVEIF